MKSHTDDWVWRRFGRDHDKPCGDPTMLTCAVPECQIANRCRLLPDKESGAGVSTLSSTDGGGK